MIFARKISAPLTSLVKQIDAATVANVGYEPGDDICPVFRFPFPIPPRFDQFLNVATILGARTRLFPYGITNPEGVLVQVGMGPVAE